MTNLEQRCIDKVEEAFVAAEAFYKREIKRVPVEFSKRMTVSAGSAIWEHDNTAKAIRLSSSILEANGEEFIKDTPGHEAAHIIAVELYGKKAMNHGILWQEVMHVIGLPIEVTHKMKTPAKKPARKFAYHSTCGQVRYLTIIKHNRLQRSKVQFYIWKDKTEVYKHGFIKEIV